MPAIPYVPNIPQATDQLSVSQGQLLINTNGVQALIDVDHVDFADANAGQHNKVTMPVQTGAPAFAAGTVGLFNLLVTTPTATYPAPPAFATNQLFLNRNDGAQIPITAASASVGSDGFAYLPSGVLLKWGLRPTTGGIQTFTIGPTNPPFSGILAVYITTNVSTASDSFVQLMNYTTTTIQINSTKRTTTANASSGFQYLVIGY